MTVKKLLIFSVIIVLTVAQGCNFFGDSKPVENDTEETVEVTLYFCDPDAAKTGEPGEHGYVTPVTREIKKSPQIEELLQSTLEELIKGPTAEDGTVYTVVQSSLEILDIEIEDGIAVIDVNEEMFGKDWDGGTLGGTIFVMAFTKTASQFEEVDKVQVLVEGEYWDDGHWVWDEPL